MSERPQKSIAATGDAIVKRQIDAEDKHENRVTLEGSKADGVTVGFDSVHEGEKVSWSIGAWFRRKFQRGGTEVGAKGEVKF